MQLYSFTFTETELETIARACALRSRHLEGGHSDNNKPEIETLDALALQFDGAQPLAESSPTVQKFRQSAAAFLQRCPQCGSDETERTRPNEARCNACEATWMPSVEIFGPFVETFNED